MIQKQDNVRHKPVLLKEVLESLQPLRGQVIIDATFGAGGYSRALLQQDAKIIALDRDPQAIQSGIEMVAEFSPNLQLLQRCFSQLDQVMDYAPDGVDGVVLDIGVSSMQLDQAERGFSFQKDGPLDMRMSQIGVSASDVVNKYKVEDLARIFYLLGEESEGMHFAKAIERKRSETLFSRTGELARLIAETTRKKINKKGKFIHPATKVFQALRIFVNDELGELIRALLAAEKILKPGGRLVVVTFHSLEDRIVKRFFTQRSQMIQSSRHLPQLDLNQPSFKMIVKGAIVPSEEEIAQNPRARSAKLRAACRTMAPAQSSDKMLMQLNKISLHD